MDKIKRKNALLLIAVVIFGGCAWWWLSRPPIPLHAGRRVDAWFHDLCSGIYGGSPKAKDFPAAFTAFNEMGPEAVPYLTQQLKYDRSGFRQQLLLFSRNNLGAKGLTEKIVSFPQRRSYAAVALWRMGPKAETAIPALLEAWARDLPEVRVNVVLALESVLRGHKTDGTRQEEWLESHVIAEAARRYPKKAAELGIKLDQGHSL